MSNASNSPRVPISMATLLPGATLGFDVFVRAASNLPPAMLFKHDEPVVMDRLKLYMDAGVKIAFLHIADQPNYQNYLNRYWLIVDDDTTPLSNRVQFMGEVMRGAVNKSFQANETEDLIASSANLAQTAVQLISRNNVALSELCDVLHHDYGTFTHSTNVSLYSILLAKKLGYSAAEQQEIAVGGMLHDLGKLEIDTKILNKPGKLNDQEFRVIMRHPALAFKRMANRDDVTLGQLMMAYQHHERVAGKGYPCGITSDEIHPYAKICAIVDVFEAITSERPYRTPMELKKASEVITEGRGSHFDDEMAAVWVDLIQEESFCNV
jgi:response regulator RpfG family c-di-GMP phosphodiesterase